MPQTKQTPFPSQLFTAVITLALSQQTGHTFQVMYVLSSIAI
ncbi:hypothetical protein [Bacillus luti]